MILSSRDTDLKTFKHKAIQWAAGFDVEAYLDSNGFADKYSKFDTLIAAGTKNELKYEEGKGFEQLNAFRKLNPGWLFGFLSYDLKNEIEDLISDNPDQLQFPDLYFFEPEHLIIINGERVEVISVDADAVLKAISNQQLGDHKLVKELTIKSRYNRNEYIAAVNTIQQHINRGDIYETNFCQEFYIENAAVDPLSMIIHLQQISPAPFSCFFKLNEHYIISASPERFLAKRGQKLISQPIKGTAKRSANDTEDKLLKESLKNNPKEQQENVMVVDLVRNDLTRSALPGTVKVEELFGIYSFEQVHQMISTVVCQKNPAISDVEAIRNTFPMGSMTGAPKVKAMRLMEKYERTKRGMYSGAVGYFAPDGDFDFNVIIRTILCNAKNRYLSFQVGSAITHSANAQQEYEECLLKAKAIFEVLGHNRS